LRISSRQIEVFLSFPAQETPLCTGTSDGKAEGVIGSVNKSMLKANNYE